MPCSNVELPLGSDLVIFSPSATQGYSRCAHSCMHVTPVTLPPSGKLTTMPLEGDFLPILHIRFRKPPSPR